MMRKFFIVWLLSLGLICKVQAAEAADPVQVLQTTVSSVMQELKDHKTELDKNPKALQRVVEHLIVPRVDFVEMARWVAGRNAWIAATPSARDSFVAAFKGLVVRTYANALLNYRDQKVDFLPLRESIENKNRVKVSSLIKESNKEPIRIDYYLINHQGNWQVYDIIIEGVSLVKGYEAQFGDDIRRRGLEVVIAKLNGAAAKNAP